MIEGILEGAPVWVWPLLGLLLVIGDRASKPRQIPVILFYFLSLLGLIPINGMVSLPFQVTAWSGYAVGFVAGAAGGYVLQGKWLLGRQGKMLSLSGEWFTMLVLMVVFWTNFAGGMMQAIRPETYSTPVFVALFATLVGAASGSFFGRAVKIINLGRI